jgi:hypothetical protein
MRPAIPAKAIVCIQIANMKTGLDAISLIGLPDAAAVPAAAEGLGGGFSKRKTD